MAKKEAGQSGAEEAILLNTAGRVAEAASSNIFIYDGVRWITPTLEEGVLPGVVRQVLLTVMRKNQILFEERPVEVSDLKNAREALLTNAIRELVPLTLLDGQPINRGAVGEQTRRLMDLFKEEIQYRFEQFESKTLGAKQSF
jgi:branched-subunit amino acid aminotransferase/4-amino-4-deoxychorismate lyase